jgi:hypothetical protein
MKQRSILDDLKDFISDELGECDYKLWPKVCELQSTELGKAKLMDMVIRYIAEEGMEIGSAIALIEQELAHNEESA